MSVKRTIKKYTGKVDLMHPSLSFAWIIMAMLAVVAIFIAIDGGKWIHGKGKAVVGAAMPSTAGKTAVRDQLGV